MEYPIYHPTLADAIQAALLHATNKRAAILVEDQISVAEDATPLTYADTRTINIPLAALKGKPTKQHFHIVIYRMDSGNYELTCYIL